MQPRDTQHDEILTASTSEPAQPASPLHRIFIGSEGLRAGWSLLVFLLLCSLLVVPTIPMFRHQTTHHAAQPHAAPQHQDRRAIDTITQDGALFLVLLLSSAVMSRIERRPFAAYGIGATPGASRQFLTGLLWGVLFLSLLVLVLKLAHLLVFDGRLLSGASLLRFGFEWALGFFTVGLFEEYFLRGFLLFTLARGLSAIFVLLFKTDGSTALGFWSAATLLAFVFGLGHGGNPGESPIGLFAAGLAALVFSLSLWRTGSLWWAIGFHATWDWAQSFLYGVADSGIMMQHHLFATHPVGRPILSGGLTGPEGSLFVLPILALIAVVIWLTLPQLPHPAPFARRTPALQTAPELS